jgi:NAD(P)-dependent dehydrogenase (short-subunit alcohol dehydrogenase family)
MARRVEGKAAIVVGGGQTPGQTIGNGRATAVVLAREGARVCVADRDLASAEATVKMISGEGGQAWAFEADITSEAAAARLVAAALERFGKLDILHNNVGIISLQTIRQVTEEEWDRLMAVNVKGVLLAIQAAIPALEASGGGSIINVSSIAGLRYSGAPLTAYAATKAGIIGLTLSAAGQLGEKRIRVNCIAPGQVHTPLVAAFLTPEGRETRRRSGLIPDEGTAWDVGWAAVYLASDESRWVTAQVLVVDAGITATMQGGGAQAPVGPN